MNNTMYDEIKRKLAIGGVSPESDILDSDIRKRKQENLDQAIVYGDIANAAVPSLMNIFTGGSYAEQAGRSAGANKYLQNRALQDQVSKKDLVSISNEEGSPEYVAAKNAIGMEPYYQTKTSSKDSSASLMKGMPVRMFNPETGARAIIAIGPDNVARRVGSPEPMDTSGWIQDLGVGTATGTDVFGTKTQDQYEKGGTGLPRKNVKTTQGLGSYMGGIPQKEAESRLKGSAKGKEKVAESLSIIGELDASEKALRSTNDPMTFSIALGQALRSVEKRLSEDEQRRFMGDDYRSVFQNAGNYIQGKMGIIPPNIRSGVTEAIKYLKSKEQGKVSANQKSYSDLAGLNKKGSETIKRTSGQGNNIDESKGDWRSNLKGLYK